MKITNILPSWFVKLHVVRYAQIPCSSGTGPFIGVSRLVIVDFGVPFVDRKDHNMSGGVYIPPFAGNSHTGKVQAFQGIARHCSTAEPNQPVGMSFFKTTLHGPKALSPKRQIKHHWSTKTHMAPAQT